MTMHPRVISHLYQHLVSSAVTPPERTLEIRQIALVAKELDPAVSELCEALGLSVLFVDPHIHMLGLKNSVMGVGDTFLEVISPLTEENTANKQIKRRKGDGGYMIMLSTSDLRFHKRRLEEEKFKVVLELNHEDIDEIHLHPRDTHQTIFSFSQPSPTRAWRWAGPRYQPSLEPRLPRIVAAYIQVDDLGSAVSDFTRLLGRAPRASGEARTFALDNGTRLVLVRATDGRGDGLSGIGILTDDPMLLKARARRSCGVEFRFFSFASWRNDDSAV